MRMPTDMKHAHERKMQTMVHHFRLVQQPGSGSRLEIVRALGSWSDEGRRQIVYEVTRTPFMCAGLPNVASMSAETLETATTAPAPAMAPASVIGFHRGMTDLQLPAREELLHQIRDLDVMLDANAVLISRLTTSGVRMGRA
jgi:hypothetical protein